LGPFKAYNGPGAPLHSPPLTGGYVLVNLPPTTVYADSTTERKLIATPWFAGSGLTAVRCSFELSEAMSPIEVGVGIQSANVPTGTPRPLPSSRARA
jgi:hypothetical protein